MEENPVSGMTDEEFEKTILSMSSANKYNAIWSEPDAHRLKAAYKMYINRTKTYVKYIDAIRKDIRFCFFGSLTSKQVTSKVWTLTKQQRSLSGNRLDGSLDFLGENYLNFDCEKIALKTIKKIYLERYGIDFGTDSQNRLNLKLKELYSKYVDYDSELMTISHEHESQKQFKYFYEQTESQISVNTMTDTQMRSLIFKSKFLLKELAEKYQLKIKQNNKKKVKKSLCEEEFTSSKNAKKIPYEKGDQKSEKTDNTLTITEEQIDFDIEGLENEYSNITSNHDSKTDLENYNDFINEDQSYYENYDYENYAENGPNVVRNVKRYSINTECDGSSSSINVMSAINHDNDISVVKISSQTPTSYRIHGSHNKLDRYTSSLSILNQLIEKEEGRLAKRSKKKLNDQSKLVLSNKKHPNDITKYKPIKIEAVRINKCHSYKNNKKNINTTPIKTAKIGKEENLSNEAILNMSLSILDKLIKAEEERLKTEPIKLDKMQQKSKKINIQKKKKIKNKFQNFNDLSEDQKNKCLQTIIDNLILSENEKLFKSPKTDVTSNEKVLLSSEIYPNRQFLHQPLKKKKKIPDSSSEKKEVFVDQTIVTEKIKDVIRHRRYFSATDLRYGFSPQTRPSRISIDKILKELTEKKFILAHRKRKGLFKRK
ncbi:hypothetical protein M153_18200012887 [Pseudoloma neurophilia]|uniref:Uncharacterized protein n=1 Tax=Pseudoloma neurophilia TaxID=146866 RepID=A0A0R0LZN6_9MICR|nr:hypothetical protein M153_18200012887 [Pseudoloma neurophilia]